MKRLIFGLMALTALASFPAQAQMNMGGMGGQGGVGGPGQKKSEDKGDVLPDIDAKVGDNVQSTFDHAEKAFKDREWLEAIAYYQHLRAKFSYNVNLATLAQLRLADIAFEREKFPEAKEYYKEFLRMHPTHVKVDYAAYQIGLCAYKDIPGEFFLLPPSSERDQSEVRAARNTMKDFIDGHPQSEYLPKAKEILAKCDDKLADHELYVAHYYVTKNKWIGVAIRAEGLAKRYPDSQLVTNALLLAIEARTRLRHTAAEEKKPDDEKMQQEAAQKDYDTLAATHPPDGVLKRGEKMLAAK